MIEPGSDVALGSFVCSEVELTVAVKSGTIRIVDGIQSFLEVKSAKAALCLDWYSSEL